MMDAKNIGSDNSQKNDEEIKLQVKEMLRKQMELISERSKRCDVSGVASLSEAMTKIAHELSFYL